MSPIQEILPTELKNKLTAFQIIDVRRPDEFVGDLGHIQGAILATLETDLETYLDKLPKAAPYVFVCKAGGRSGAAAQLAQRKGFQNISNLVGGMLAWNAAGLEIEKK